MACWQGDSTKNADFYHFFTFFVESVDFRVQKNTYLDERWRYSTQD